MKYVFTLLGIVSAVLVALQSVSSTEEIVTGIMKHGTVTDLNTLIQQSGIDHPFYHGQTLLYTAVTHKRIDFILFLLKRGASPIGSNGQSLLEHAMKRGDELMFCTLLDTHKPCTLASLLRWVLYKGSPAMLVALLDKGISPEYRFEQNNTPLHIAAAHGREDLISLLLSLLVDINALNQRGETPLMRAVAKRHCRTVQQLLNAGASLNQWRARESALHLIARTPHKWRNNAVCSLLLAQKPQLDTMYDFSMRTPLQIAVKCKNIPITRALLTAGADPNAHHPNSKSPLSLVASQPTINRQLLGMLCAAGADMDCTMQYELDWPRLSRSTLDQKRYDLLKECIPRGAPVHNAQLFETLSKKQKKKLYAAATQRQRTITTCFRDAYQVPTDLIQLIMSFTDTPLPRQSTTQRQSP